MGRYQDDLCQQPPLTLTIVQPAAPTQSQPARALLKESAGDCVEGDDIRVSSYMRSNNSAQTQVRKYGIVFDINNDIQPQMQLWRQCVKQWAIEAFASLLKASAFEKI